MSLNRNRYSSAPLMHMKNQRQKQPSAREPHGSEPPILEERPAPKPRRFAILQIVMAVGLPALFLLSLLLPSPLLRWAFIGIALFCVLLMWLLKAFVKNARATLSLIYIVLSVVIGVALATSRMGSGARTPTKVDTSSIFSQSSVLDTPELNLGAVSPSADPSATPVISSAQIKLEEFMTAWTDNQSAQMLALCRPSWSANLESPERSLFNLLGLTRPSAYQIVNVYGSEADSSRTLEMLVDMEQSNGKQLTKRYQIIMVRVNDVWYIDPDSLNSIAVVDVTATPAPGTTSVPTTQPGLITTNAPTPTINPGMTLYYNTDGGSYYHTDPNCASVKNKKYLPLTGTFSYAELNSSSYKALKRCATCNAPVRPSVSAQ